MGGTGSSCNCSWIEDRKIMTEGGHSSLIIRPTYSFSLVDKGATNHISSGSSSSSSSSSDVQPVVLNFNLGCGGGTYGLKRTGQIIWDGSVVLARFIECNPETMRGKSVLEIGSGTCALPSHAAAFVGAKHVTATDTQEEIPELQINIRNNCNLIPTLVNAAPLDWSNYEITRLSPAYLDVLICADVIYEISLELLVTFFNDLFTTNPQVEVYMTNTDRKHVRLFRRRFKDFVLFEEINFHKGDYPNIVMWKIINRSLPFVYS